MKFLALIVSAAALASAAVAPAAPCRTAGSSPDDCAVVDKRAIINAPRNAAPEPTFAPSLDKRTGGCNANNCARAVTGTRDKEPNVASRQADCVSFQKLTVLTNYGGNPVTTITPTAVPVYASACSTPVSPQSAYASACSCWGYTQQTVTSAAPQACTLDYVQHQCPDGHNGLCYCWEDKLGNLYCDGTYFGGWTYGTNGMKCSQDSDCPGTNPTCATDGLCDIPVAPSNCQ